MFETVRAIHEALRTESTWAFVGAVVFAFAAVGGILAILVDKAYKNNLEEHRPVVSLECQVAALPISFPADSVIWYMDLDQSLQSLGSMRSGATDANSTWPRGDANIHGMFVYRCRVINYGDGPVYAASMRFHVDFLEARETEATIQGRHGLVSGGVVSSYDHVVNVPITLAPKGGEFTFYMYNTSPQFVHVTMPQDGFHEPATGKVALRIKRAAPQNVITFSPNVRQNGTPKQTAPGPLN
jgi:hypothetical protein